jgi:putative DNA primase/helicase
LGGDKGTHNLDRVLRIPGTYNFKLAGNPREVRVIHKNGPLYDFDDFKDFINIEEPKRKDTNDRKKSEPIKSESSSTWDGDIEKLAVSDRIKDLIVNGKDSTYSSRSEADQAVITALVHKGVGESDIKAIFKNYKIGEKYRGHSAPDEYLSHNIKKAEEFSNLTEEERQDPLFISGALHKNDNGKYQLKIVPFQEYMNKKHMLKFLEKERTFFRYSGKCYEQCSEDRLNNLCQTELGKHRNLFPPASKANFIHFAIGNDMVDDDKAYEDQIRYLTLQNGLYDLSQHKLIEHNPSIFTTNLLPYDYNPTVVCPRWLQYLDEVFISDAETIKFVQEAVGYAFHKSIPKAVLFFIIGDGGNGKSVFIDVISALCGKENVCNISLNKLNDEKYLPELFGKMINVSGETPNKKCMNTDLVKAVVAGDWVTGREVYKKPSKFKPYAKHYLGMNTLPDIEDNTHGMWRRIHVIEFPRKFAEHEMDVELTEKLMGELSGIFNWALEGYKRLGGQKFIFSESSAMCKSKKQYQQQSNSVLDFIDNCFKDANTEDSSPFKNLYDCYQGFCATEGNKRCFPKKEFRAILENEGFEVTNSSKHANQLRVFGVKYEVVYE